MQPSFNIEQLQKAPPPDSSMWQPTKAMMWYDSIIDVMLAEPGASLKEIAAALGRHPVTIGLVVRSDLFKARLAQRREAFNEELNTRLVGKLGRVAEKALDLTIARLESQQTAVPLPLLHTIASESLERLGYGVKPAAAAPTVQVNVGGQQVIAPVSAEVLAGARRNLLLVEQGSAKPSQSDSPSSPSIAQIAAGPRDEGGETLSVAGQARTEES